MNNISKTFIKLLQEGSNAAKNIVDPRDKALAYAALAQAVACTKLVEDSEDAGEPETQETTKKETKKTKKDSLKPESGKVEQAPKEEKEEVAPVPAEEPTSDSTEVTIDEEWTDEMVSLKAEQRNRLKEYVDCWGTDYVFKDCVGAWSEGSFTGEENIRPTNIDGFITYLDELAKSFEEEQ